MVSSFAKSTVGVVSILACSFAFGACTIDRNRSPDDFACGFGGPCLPDAQPPQDAVDFTFDARPPPDSGLFTRDAIADAGIDAKRDAFDIPDTMEADATPVDTGVDAGPPDTGLMSSNSPCINADDCDTNDEICFDGICQRRCDVAAGIDCFNDYNGAMCNPTTGRCISALELGTHCLSNTDCKTDQCLAFTSGANLVRTCTYPCSAASECPLTFGCEEIAGMDFCLHETVIGGTLDTRAGGFCDELTNTCQSGWCATVLQECLESCNKTSDCTGFGGNCRTFSTSSTVGTPFASLCISNGGPGLVGSPCNQNAQCQTGVCDRDSRTCAAPCCSEADCTERDQSCIVYALDPTTPTKICRARRLGAGTGEPGASCTRDSECQSEVCNPVDPNNPLNNRKCSSHCCSDQDCTASLPLGGRCRPAVGPVVNNTIVGECTPN